MSSRCSGSFRCTARRRGPRYRVIRASAPTVSKAVASLLHLGLIEEADAIELTGGRPTRKLRMAGATVQVIGAVIDARQCTLVSSGLDGTIHEGRTITVRTPTTYEGLIDALAEQAARMIEHPGIATLGLGISMPGLIDYRRAEGILSPNLHLTDGHAPGRDLGARLGLECVVLQESHALCLAERDHGGARGLDDFAMLDVSTGVGMGVMSGGRLLRGHRGFAGEIGHVTVVPGGRRCGCGNRGCLETVVSDSAFARMISKRVGRRLDVEDSIALIRAGTISARRRARGRSTLPRDRAGGLDQRLQSLDPVRLRSAPGFGRRALLPRARADAAEGPRPRPRRLPDRARRASKPQGAIAGIIRHLTESLAPSLD